MLIDPCAADWLLSLPIANREPSSDAPAGQAWYALVDTAFVPGCYRLLQRHKDTLPARYLFDLSSDPRADLAAVSPVLFPLHESQQKEWRAILQQTDRWPMLTLISTTESLDELALRLSSWCVVDADGQDFVLRFADTRRLPDVVGVLDETQRAELFGPAREILYRDRVAQWQNLPTSPTAQPPAIQVKLSAKQFGALVEASGADEIMAQFSKNEPTLLAAHKPSQAYSRISRALALATSLGISPSDRTNWSRLFLRWEAVEDLPDLSTLIQQYRNDGYDYFSLEQKVLGSARGASLGKAK